MCGIVAVVNVQGEKALEQVRLLVPARAKRLTYRGPSASGTWEGKTSFLAHERLAIVDLESGAQPILNREKNLALIVNGEIYNHMQVRKRLPGSIQFRTASDSEVIMHLYEQYGASASWINELNGIFGFLIMDERTQTYFIARDHIGIIPLYWGKDALGQVWIASELKALHDVCLTFEDFPPGHCYSSANKVLERWYNPHWLSKDAILHTSPCNMYEFRRQFIAAVKRQLMSDVPYGVLLSGGLDSSLIASIMARLILSKGNDCSLIMGEISCPKLPSFSIGLRNSPDLTMAKRVAKYLGTTHYEFTFTIEEGLHAIRQVIYHLETYDVTTVRAATPMYLMSQKIGATGVKVVLSGEGSDEIFGGYLYFHKCPSPEEMLKETVRKLQQLHKFDCLRANKATAAWAIEARVPFLDLEFLNYAMAIDPSDKMCGNSKQGEKKIEKYIVRKAFEGFLPDEILWRQKEQFSDGVGYSWIDSIKAEAEKVVTNEEYANAAIRFPYNTPVTKEAYFMRSIFEDLYPENSAQEVVPGGPSVACSTPAAILWDQSFREYADCSGRSVLGVHENALSEEARANAVGVAVPDHLLANHILH
jgi:asparagine synthase (glutamine-hydrolysing)